MKPPTPLPSGPIRKPVGGSKSVAAGTPKPLQPQQLKTPQQTTEGRSLPFSVGQNLPPYRSPGIPTPTATTSGLSSTAKPGPFAGLNIGGSTLGSSTVGQPSFPFSASVLSGVPQSEAPASTTSSSLGFPGVGTRLGGGVQTMAAQSGLTGQLGQPGGIQMGQSPLMGLLSSPRSIPGLQPPPPQPATPLQTSIARPPTTVPSTGQPPPPPSYSDTTATPRPFMALQTPTPGPTTTIGLTPSTPLQPQSTPSQPQMPVTRPPIQTSQPPPNMTLTNPGPMPPSIAGISGTANTIRPQISGLNQSIQGQLGMMPPLYSSTPLVSSLPSAGQPLGGSVPTQQPAAMVRQPTAPPQPPTSVPKTTTTVGMTPRQQTPVPGTAVSEQLMFAIPL